MLPPAHGAWEVLVVDNNSSDGTRDLVQELQLRNPAFSLSYHYEPTPGIAFARNAGILQAASADIIGFIDDDVLVEPDWACVVHEAFATDERLGVLGGRLEPNPESPMPSWLSSVNQAPLGLIDYGPERRVLTMPYLATANCAFRRQALIDEGLFDVRMGRRPDKLYADEDTDMIARVQSAGGRVVYDPGLNGRHFVPTARMTHVYFRRWYREKGEGAGRIGARGRRAVLGIALFDYRRVVAASVRYVGKRLLGRATLEEELAILYFKGVVSGRLAAVRNR